MDHGAGLGAQHAALLELDVKDGIGVTVGDAVLAAMELAAIALSRGWGLLLLMMLLLLLLKLLLLKLLLLMMLLLLLLGGRAEMLLWVRRRTEMLLLLGMMLLWVLSMRWRGRGRRGIELLRRLPLGRRVRHCATRVRD